MGGEGQGREWDWVRLVSFSYLQFLFLGKADMVLSAILSCLRTSTQLSTDCETYVGTQRMVRLSPLRPPRPRQPADPTRALPLLRPSLRAHPNPSRLGRVHRRAARARRVRPRAHHRRARCRPPETPLSAAVHARGAVDRHWSCAYRQDAREGRGGGFQALHGWTVGFC